MRILRRSPPIAFLAVIVFAADPSYAQGADEPVRTALANAREIVRGDANRADQLTALHSVAADLLDTRDMGLRVLGPVLETRPPVEQMEFFELFDEFMIRAYLRRLILFRNPRFAFQPTLPDGDRARVKTKILTPNDAFYVDYEMRRRDGGWLATDIIVEGISLRSNYQEQFEAVLRDRTFPELLDLMRRKLRIMREGDDS